MLLVWLWWLLRMRRVPVGAFVVLATLLFLLTMRLSYIQRALVTSVSSTPKPEYKAIEVLPYGGMRTRDLYEAGYTRPHPELCHDSGAHIRLLILVASDPWQFNVREAIRLTWGHPELRKDVVVAFVLGQTPSNLRKALDEEDSQYGDVIEAKFVDSDYNATLKSIAMLQWKDTYCPRVRYLLNTLDDSFVNVERVLRFIEDPVRRNESLVIWGCLNRNVRPVREPGKKHYAPKEEFPGFVYPDFMNREGYVMTADAVRKILHAAGRGRFLRHDSVYVTGVLAGQMGIRRQHEKSFLRKQLYRSPCELQRYMITRRNAAISHLDLWLELLDRKCKGILLNEKQEEMSARKEG